jgi:phosphate starvation-inducible PhoH-like protein
MQRRPKKLTKSSNSIRIFKPKVLVAKTDNQQNFIDTIRGNDITLCNGPAGCGKSHIVCALAVEYLKSNKIDKIIISCPTIEIGASIGFLPGSMVEKISPYTVPLIQELLHYLSPEEMDNLRQTQLEILPLNFMRGRNFINSFIILDEAQNANQEQLKTFLTRFSNGSKMVIVGDTSQSDLPRHLRGGFQFCMDRLTRLDGIGIARMTEKDVVRHHLIGKILDRLSE